MRVEALPALADAIGRHALPLFLALLAALLLLVRVAWSGHAQMLPRARTGLPRPALLLLYALAGFAIVVGAAAGFAEIAERLDPVGAMARADEALAASISAHVAPATLRVFALLTHLGDPAWLALLGAGVTLWLWSRRQRALVLGWVLALGGNALLNPALKRIFERMRPVHEYGLVREMGFSFPSGHTSGAIVTYGMLAYVALRTLPAVWHLPAVLCATAMAFTVGCSRVFLQVHYLSDVLAGFASGGAWLVVCVMSVEASRHWRGTRTRQK
jgi:membrane-associated phospholipid phosphatase